MSPEYRVLHILNELKPSGAETMLRSAANRWRAEGNVLHILSTGSNLGPYASELELAGYTIHHIPFSHSPLFLFRVYRLLRQLSPHVVHLHTERANFRLGLITSIVKPCVAIRTIHSAFCHKGLRRAIRGIQRKILQACGIRFVAIGKGVHDVERERFGLNCHIIPNWYDSDHFRPPTIEERETERNALHLPDDAIVLTLVGNCSDVKNHTLLLRALANLEPIHNWLLLHVGMEQEGLPERALAAELGIKDRIRFLGHQSDVRKFLWSADLFVMPSKVEGFGIAALEAISSGVFTITTNVPGLAQLAAEFDGLPAIPDSVAAWIQALDKALQTSRNDLRTIAATWATCALDNYSIDHGAKAYQRLYLSSQR